ncbi:MAG TPA: hypothetical protein VGO92_14685 [Acidimicrobiales bacterium]|nr:hypothetical protein [Acidimicrobiales bacterium]
MSEEAEAAAQAELDALAALPGGGCTSTGSTGIAGDVAVVFLPPCAEGAAAAARLYERFGSSIRITLGFQPYPAPPGRDEPEPEVASAVAPARAETVPAPDGVTLEVRLASSSVVSGHGVEGVLVVGNDGPLDREFSGGLWLLGCVVDPADGAVVGLPMEPMPLVLVGRRAPAGGSVEVPVRVGTAGTRRGRPAAVPPGRYEVRVRLPYEGAEIEAPPVPLEVV